MKSLTAVSLLAMAAMAAALFFALERNSPAAAPGGGAGAGGGGGGGRAGRGGAAAPAAPVPLTLTTIVPDGKPHVFAAKNKTFSIDGQPTILIAGEMHFGRILPEDFETRVKQAKAMGLNAISFYLFWNLSEPEEGKFDFTGMNDVHRMLKICQENGMWAVLRPGPYCCAEVDYGGIPYWTATGDNENVKIRSTDPKYLAWEKRYIDRLGQEIGDMQVTKGGPLLMVQLENEFGMVAGVPGTGGYDAVKSLTPIFKGAGFNVPFYVCDPGSIGGRGGTNPYGDDILRAPNGMSGGGGAEATYQRNLAASGDFPLYSPEVYTAWFSGWGQPIATRNASIDSIRNSTSFFLDHNMSWCYYMFFGGTNWGFNSGCNEWLPLQTTYDYNAPIDEAGRVTEKYRVLRGIISDKTARKLPDPPADPVVVDMPAIKLTQGQTVLQSLNPASAKKSAKPTSMEDMHQAYGFVLYRKQFPSGIKGKLELKQVMDYAVTMVNGKTVGKSFIGYGPESNTIELNESGPVTLDILVENLGRISVITSANSQGRARKGLIGGAFLDGQELTDWDNYSLPYTDGIASNAAGTGTQTGPTFYHGKFNIDKPASTFVNLSNWGMGVVWVNGHNLGRFWDIGGGRSLFLSEHFLKPGTNDITVLELHDAPAKPEINGTTKMVETPAKAFAVKLDVSNAGGGAAAGRGRGRAGPAPATQPINF